ncbi:hypothetical protein TrLO_g4780 [Triparma laevis f. longispina]|uniref:MFS general substrate transporter n=1 Tax=Triparma laevis f. longispina TaxID=1714387 RepID=A0A9W6ZR32_9STRA|nr:hypothetical protein TrLO_g4780 [Triparma laevis f. longispina]
MSSPPPPPPTTYTSLLHNRAFLFYMLSYLLTQLGTWLNYIATLTLTSSLSSSSSSSYYSSNGSSNGSSNMNISLLLLLRLLPSLIISPIIGGPIADYYDKRKSMIFLDLLSSLLTLLIYPLSSKLQSLPLLYISVFGLSSIDAIYNPCKNSIIPFMFLNDSGKINKATSLIAIAWSLMGSLGAMIGGFVTDRGGVEICFYVDGVTFLGSAIFMYAVGEEWKNNKLNNNIASSTESNNVNNKPKTDYGTTFTGSIKYLTTNGTHLLPLLFLKSYGCLLWGSADLLNVNFSKGNEFNLGLIFASVGVGCLVGPLIMDRIKFRFMKGKEEGKSKEEMGFMVRCCVFAIFIIAISFIGMSINETLNSIIIFTVVRSMGSSILWVYSSVILQVLTDERVLGRVVSIEFAAATSLEGLSAFLAAGLLDFAGFTERGTALFFGILGCVGVVGPLYIYLRRNWGDNNKGYRMVDDDEIDDDEDDDDNITTFDIELT